MRECPGIRNGDGSYYDSFGDDDPVAVAVTGQHRIMGRS